MQFLVKKDFNVGGYLIHKAGDIIYTRDPVMSLVTVKMQGKKSFCLSYDSENLAEYFKKLVSEGEKYFYIDDVFQIQETTHRDRPKDIIRAKHNIAFLKRQEAEEYRKKVLTKMSKSIQNKDSMLYAVENLSLVLNMKNADVEKEYPASFAMNEAQKRFAKNTVNGTCGVPKKIQDKYIEAVKKIDQSIKGVVNRLKFENEIDEIEARILCIVSKDKFQKFTNFHWRIGGKIDVYPTTKKYFFVGKRGMFSFNTTQELIAVILKHVSYAE